MGYSGILRIIPGFHQPCRPWWKSILGILGYSGILGITPGFYQPQALVEKYPWNPGILWYTQDYPRISLYLHPHGLVSLEFWDIQDCLGTPPILERYLEMLGHILRSWTLLESILIILGCLDIFRIISLPMEYLVVYPYFEENTCTVMIRDGRYIDNINYHSI